MSTSHPRSWCRPFESAPEPMATTDAIVCGYGGAGASAALEARLAGCEVMVLERASGGGGATGMSSCEMYLGGSGGTALQKDLGLEDSTENFVAYLTESFGPHGDPEKIRVYAEGAAAHFDWVESLGVPYKREAIYERVVEPFGDQSLLYTGNERAWPFRDHIAPVPRGHVPSKEGNEGGRMFMQALMAKVEAEGVQVQTDARVTALLQDASGRIRGVMVRIDGKEQAIYARRGVVLTAGGFVMNRDMIERHAPQVTDYAEPYGSPHDMGDGIQMGAAAGGHAINMSEVFLSLALYPPACSTFGILVNRYGQRFINEDAYLARLAHYAAQQDGQEIYLLVQNEDFEMSPYLEPPRIVGTGDSIAEVEAESPLPEGTLQHTVSFFNEHAAKGEDPLFHKSSDWLKPIVNGPFALVSYAPADMKYHFGENPGYLMFTLGGLETSVDGEVLTPQGEPVPGLFAAGRTTAGLPRTSKGYASGMSVGDATFFGRLAGQRVARESEMH